MRIDGYEYEPCRQCGGRGAYWVGRGGPGEAPPFADVLEWEYINPCDYCMGKGTEAVPVVADDSSQPTLEDIEGYGPRDN